MNALPVTDELVQVAERIMWFDRPQNALANPILFLNYAMRYAMPEDMNVIRRYVSDDDLREALVNAHPGIIDGRSWAYWHLKLDMYPPPKLPERHLEDVKVERAIPRNP
ncbi:MAG: hypothetical protein NPIRA02_32460 [Nitrospirales bacterium]|nr:MAG: hypothetical protein NPIRA02_32460 [Nitrospirales bacterium]